MLDKDFAQVGRFSMRALAFLVAFICSLCRELLFEPVLVVDIVIYVAMYTCLAFLRVNKKRHILPLMFFGVLNVWLLTPILSEAANLQRILIFCFNVVAYAFLTYLAYIPFRKSPKYFSKTEWIPALCMSSTAVVLLTTIDGDVLIVKILCILEYIVLAFGMYFLSAYLVAPKKADEDFVDLSDEREWEETEKPTSKRFKMTSKWFLITALFCLVQQIVTATVDSEWTSFNLISGMIVFLLFTFLNPRTIWYKLFLWVQVYIHSVFFLSRIQEAVMGILQSKLVYEIPHQGAHIAVLLLLLLLPALWVEIHPKLRYIPALFSAVAGVAFLFHLIQVVGMKLVTVPYPYTILFILWIGYYTCYTIAIYQLSQKIFVRRRRKSPPNELVTTKTQPIE